MSSFILKSGVMWYKVRFSRNFKLDRASCGYTQWNVLNIHPVSLLFNNFNLSLFGVSKTHSTILIEGFCKAFVT